MEQLTTYGLLSALALCVTLGMTGLCCRKNGMDYGKFIRFAVLALPLTWFVSRIVFVAASYSYYLDEVEDLSLALHFWDGGYSMMGAYFGLLLAAVLAAKWAKLPAGKLLDALAMGMPLGLFIERLAERGTGLGEGAEASAGWPAWLAIETEYGTLITVFVFEAAAALLILLALCAYRKCCKTRRDGDLMAMFTLLFGFSQVMLESFRSDGHMEIHMGVHIQQVIAAALILAVIAVWSHQARRNGRLPKWWFIVNAVLAVALVAFAVVAEFGVDRWDNKFSAYGLMFACLVGLLGLAMFNQHKANN